MTPTLSVKLSGLVDVLVDALHVSTESDDSPSAAPVFRASARGIHAEVRLCGHEFVLGY